MEHFDYDPNNLPDDLLAAIGLVTACFAQTEEFIEDAVAGLAGVDYEVGLALTTHMPMQMRLDAIRASAEITIDDLDALDELDRILATIETAIVKRNAVSHDRWCIDRVTDETFTIKHSARGTVKADLSPATVKQILADAKFIYESGLGLFNFLKSNGRMPPILDRGSRHHKSKAARKKRVKLR